MRPSPATQFLRQLLESHGVTCREEGESLRLGETGPRALAQLIHPPGTDPERTVQLDVSFEPWAGRWILESCVGIGATPEQAVREAFANFARGSLHVLLAAFVRESDAHVTVEEWHVGGIRRRTLLGEMLVRGANAPEVPNLTDWLESLKGALRTLPLPTGTHWLRVYFAQLEEKPMTLDVQLDNEEWPELKAALEEARWPRAPGFLGIRLFLVLQGGCDVSRAVAAFAESPGRGYDTLRLEFRKQGATVLESEKLVAYIPEAFCTVLSRGMGAQFQESVIFREDGTAGTHEVLLAHDPLWREAVQHAEWAMAGKTLSREQFEAVVCRSALLNSVNQALNKGWRLEDLLFAPLSIPLSAEGMSALRSITGTSLRP